MARSRNIKPGFFTNDELAECSMASRLLFAGLWTIADKEGRLEDRPKKIKALVMPFDDVDCDDCLKQLNERGFIIRYSVNGDGYIQIHNWKKHQNPHCKEAASEIPAYDINSKSTVQEQCINDDEVNCEHDSKSQPVENKEAQEKHGALSVQEQEKHINDPADSLNLIPDSLNLIPYNTQPADADCVSGTKYAFSGKVIRLTHKDFDTWQRLYQNINLRYELEKLDIEFAHEKPKNWFITASQKLSYQNKLPERVAPAGRRRQSGIGFEPSVPDTNIPPGFN